MSASGKFVLVLLESLAGTGHKFSAIRPKLSDKLELYRLDPTIRQWVIYREIKKIRTIRKDTMK